MLKQPSLAALDAAHDIGPSVGAQVDALVFIGVAAHPSRQIFVQPRVAAEGADDLIAPALRESRSY